MVRNYLATFARTEAGARRVLMLTLDLARMDRHEGPASAAALSAAGWCAPSPGRWELADGLALRSLDTAHNTLAERVREMAAGQWLADVLTIESDFGTAAVRRCSERVLPRAHRNTTVHLAVLTPGWVASIGSAQGHPLPRDGELSATPQARESALRRRRGCAARRM